ncbi:MAG: hypothetical protein L0Z50_33710 [Verrucomicrobiales bacterium]|nr:hypothetical protein [Verrucomicrobiales bacterium]
MANSTATCAVSPKWAATLNDATVFAPQQRVKARVLKDQAGIPADHILVRDHGSEFDVAFEDDHELDLAEGNVFFTVPRCNYSSRGECSAPAKRAFFVDDRPEVTLNPEQTGRTLRELFGLTPAVRLFRDYESPRDEFIALDARVNFIDGPLFYTRRSGIGLTIVINKQTFGETDGVKPTMTGRDIAALVTSQPDNAEVTRQRGTEKIPVGLNEEVEIKGCEEFTVIRCNVVGGYEAARIERELNILRENGAEVTFQNAPVPAVIYHRLPTRRNYRHLAATDVLVSVPSGYPGVMLDGAYLPQGSPLLGRVEGSPQGQHVPALGRDWQLVSYHPHNGGGGPPWDKDKHGFHTYLTEVLSWIQRAKE